MPVGLLHQGLDATAPVLVAAMSLLMLLAQLDKGALATGSCYGNPVQCYSYSYSYQLSFPATTTGSLSWWNSLALSTNPPDGSNAHLDQVVWLTPTSNNSNAYVEVGLAARAREDGCTTICYQGYWEDHNGKGAFFHHAFFGDQYNPIPVPNGTLYYYLMVAHGGGTNYWDIYMSASYSGVWTYEGQSTNQLGSTVATLGAGMEDMDGKGTDYNGSLVDADESSGQFATGNMGYWNNQWNYLSLTPAPVDSQCNGSNGGYCLTGSSPGVGAWNDSKS